MNYPGVWGLQALGYQQFAAGAVDTAQSLTVPVGTALVIFEPETQAIRFRDDGTDPTTTVGMPVAVGEMYEYAGAQPTRIRVIASTAGAILNVLYYGTKTL
jgi:hypothetical protein